MKVKNVICRGKLRTIEDAVDAWKAEHVKAMRIQNIEELVHECLGASDYLKQWNNESWKQLMENNLRAVQEEGEMLRRAFRNASALFSPIMDAVKDAENQSYRIEKAPEFQKAIDEVESMSAKLEKHWPFIDLQMVEESRAAMERGDYVSVEDMLRELQG